MSDQRIPKPGEWWREKGGYQFSIRVLATQPLENYTNVIYAIEEKRYEFRTQTLVLSAFHDRFAPVSPEGDEDRAFWDKRFLDLALKYKELHNKMKEPRFIKFKRYNNSDTLYVRFDQIQGVSNTKVYTTDGGAYAEVNDAAETFEKALKEDP